MRPPSPGTWLIGNPVVSLIVMIGGIAVLAMWFMGHANGWAALGAVLLASLAARASEKVSAYAAWQREWNGGGVTFTLPRVPRPVLGGMAWLWLAWLALQPANGDPAVAVASGLFWIVSLLMAVVGLVRFVRRAGARRGGSATVVKVCLGVPMRSASVQQAFAAIQPPPR